MLGKPTGAGCWQCGRASDDREYTEAQKAQHEKFRLAVAYGKGAKDLPEYKELAEARKICSFNVATADFLHPPEVTAIYLSSYQGHEGDTIEVRAIDDVAVKEVGLMIVDDQNTVVEQGKMTQVPNDNTRWTYTATANASASHVQVIVDAADLTSQVTQESEEKEL